MKVLKELNELVAWLVRLVVYEAGRTVGRYQARRDLRNEAKRLTKSLKSSNVAFLDALEAVDRMNAEKHKYDPDKVKFTFVDQTPLIKIQAVLEAHKELLIRDGIAARNGEEPSGFPGQFDFWTPEYQERHKTKEQDGN